MQDLLTDFDYELPLASRRRRWVGCFIDYFFYIIVFVSINYAFGHSTINEEGKKVTELTGLQGFLATVLPWLLFFPVIESLNDGSTLGKAMVGIRTVKENGDRLSFGKSLLKHLFDMIDYFPFFGITGLIVASNNTKRQRVGDLVAKTIVIDSIEIKKG